ncbi:hypothetical protein D3C78_563190 [compost metagenome]
MVSPTSSLPSPVTRRPWLPPVAVLRAPVVVMLAPSLRLAVPPFSTLRPIAPHDEVPTEPPLILSVELESVTTTPRLLLPLALPPTITLVLVNVTVPPDSTITPVMSWAVITAPVPVLGSRITLLPLAPMWPPSWACKPVCPLALAAVVALFSMCPVLNWMASAAPALTPVVLDAPSLTVSPLCTPAVSIPTAPATVTFSSASASVTCTPNMPERITQMICASLLRRKC